VCVCVCVYEGVEYIKLALDSVQWLVFLNRMVDKQGLQKQGLSCRGECRIKC